ncbi:MAG: 2-succinyl-6-hydroxy-2,4-cyclohexadiene-1-carboxylate synthase [Opitutales bacterium]|jgi:2-succinyl-6-hydroxy-2,4-cyclohexadiene-1-carboxylate synthase|nr:2-succinyl-6-hydroxy-2,4-cyclohexadiene-1-carboxylate synthase [Opitutales bacterium]
MHLGEIERWEGKQSLPKVICLHGFLGCGKDFKIVRDNYAGHPTIIAPDFPDYSQSPTCGYSWESCIQALDKLIVAESKDAACILLGYSMGGRIALQYALQHADNLAGLVLVGATPGIADEKERAARKEKDIAQANMLREQSLDDFLKHWFKQDIIRAQSQISEPYQSDMRRTRESNNSIALAQSLSFLGTGSMPSAWEHLANLHQPTLLVTGDGDEKFKTIAGNMETQLPNAQHATIKDAGHACCFEKPLAFTQALDSFLSSLID